MSTLFSHVFPPARDRAGQTDFNDTRIQATGEKHWGDLKPEEKKEIIQSVAIAVAHVFFAILLTVGSAGLLTGTILISPLFMVAFAFSFPATLMMWTLAASAIKDAVKTVQKHLPPKPDVEIIE